MVGKEGSGRPAGFKHSRETRAKISRGRKGQFKGPEHRANISDAQLIHGLGRKCVLRLEELRANYPDEQEFFDTNEDELLFAMRDIRTEKELNDIRRHIETAPLRVNEPYQYSSSSCFAAEDALIALLDFKLFLQKYH